MATKKAKVKSLRKVATLVKENLKDGYNAGKLAAGKDRRKMNAAEAIINFLGYASTRPNPLILSRNHNYAPVVEFAEAFINYHKLGPVREGMTRKTDLNHLDHINNLPPIAEKPYTADDAFADLINIMDKTAEHDQNKIIARFLQRVKERRTAAASYAKEARDEFQKRDDVAFERLNELNNILLGNYSVV